LESSQAKYSDTLIHAKDTVFRDLLERSSCGAQTKVAETVKVDEASYSEQTYRKVEVHLQSFFNLLHQIMTMMSCAFRPHCPWRRWTLWISETGLNRDKNLAPGSPTPLPSH